jgi:SAM-dependent methyltransferase
MFENMIDRIWKYLVRRFDQSAGWHRLASHIAMADPVVAAKIYPHSDSEIWWTENVPPSRPGLAPEEMPVPPADLWEGYGKEPAQYLGSGKHHVAKMLELLARDGVPIERTKRVLEFGSSAGRMLRWLTPFAEGRELWGADIGSKAIHWAQAHLNPLNFVCNTTAPHLPFPDATFDLIYAGSVFSHIADLADAWLLELRRILAPGGVMYLTIHDKHSLKLLLDVHQTKLARWMREENAKHSLAQKNFAKLVIARTPKGDQVFYDSERLREHWGRWLEVLSVNPEAYGYQTAMILRKPVS